MFAMAMALTGVLVTYGPGGELGRENFHDDGKTLRSEIVFSGHKLIVTLEPGKATVELDGKKLEHPIPPGTLALENGNWQAYARAAAEHPDARTPVPVKVLLPSSGITLDGKLTVTPRPDKSRRVELALGPMLVDVDVAPNGVVTHARVPLQGLEVRPEGAAPPVPPKKRMPANVSEERVEIDAANGKVRGTLWHPPIPSGHKVPIAILIAGSGPTDRDGNSSIGLRTDCYRLLAEALANAGIASIRYDKRGVGGSDRVSEQDLDANGYVDDAAAFVKKARADGRFSKVTVIGHSEGGLVALLLAQKVPLDGLVLI